MARPAIRFPDNLSFRVPRTVSERLRSEAARSNGDLADVAREYLVLGMATADAANDAARPPDTSGCVR